MATASLERKNSSICLRAKQHVAQILKDHCCCVFEFASTRFFDHSQFYTAIVGQRFFSWPHLSLCYGASNPVPWKEDLKILRQRFLQLLTRSPDKDCALNVSTIAVLLSGRESRSKQVGLADFAGTPAVGRSAIFKIRGCIAI